MIFWIGDVILSRAIEDASMLAVRRHLEEAMFREQVKAVEFRVEALERRFISAAAAFMNGHSTSTR